MLLICLVDSLVILKKPSLKFDARGYYRKKLNIISKKNNRLRMYYITTRDGLEYFYVMNNLLNPNRENQLFYTTELNIEEDK